MNRHNFAEKKRKPKTRNRMKPVPSPTYTDATQWCEMSFLQTGGTRGKCWIQSPNDYGLYFFKESLHREGRDYSSEFWMEILSSKIGQSFGMHMLDYNIALRGDRLGCISANMCGNGEELVELKKLLTGTDNTYNPASAQDKKRYTFAFLARSLSHFGLGGHITDFIRVLVFDAIIGNQDRHQDNWGFIRSSGDEAWETARFSAVYDSGSSLGRELTDDRIKQMLHDDVQFMAYVRRGKAELRLTSDKVSYWTLLADLERSGTYGETTRTVIEEFTSSFDQEVLHTIVYGIDRNLPAWHKSVSPERKEFIVKLVCQRIEELKRIATWEK